MVGGLTLFEVEAWVTRRKKDREYLLQLGIYHELTRVSARLQALTDLLEEPKG